MMVAQQLYEGVDLGKEGATSPHDRFFYHKGDRLTAVRSGPWKAFRNGRLYHLEEDLGETRNVAADRRATSRAFVAKSRTLSGSSLSRAVLAEFQSSRAWPSATAASAT